MTILLIVVSTILALISAWLFWQVRAQKALIEDIRQESHGPDYSRDPEMLLTLKVLDPIAVARRESRSARLLADRMPIMVTKLVYQEVMKELQKELEDREIAVVMQLDYR
ncbi:hypothetical protein [Marinobacter sp. CHS3-4]|uniref:hypothetical protein n=1 Tax=Marinobacter sp. CHS3-4 TaxID=3045174 RepID=UPI0024B508EC|nr:hypothetical protein [Marinobacter sp. CHS3-4]MDI9245425.1 hypothetical protein [Marinobacter sp. CHS3-4]